MKNPREVFAALLAASQLGWAAAPPRPRVSAPPPSGPAAAWKDCVVTEPHWPDTARVARGSALVRYPGGRVEGLLPSERTITGPRTQLCWAGPVAVGPAGEVYVLNRARQYQGEPAPTTGWTSWVTVYDSSAQGDVAPSRILGLATPGFGDGVSLAVDREGYLYIGSAGGPSLDSGPIAGFKPGTEHWRLLGGRVTRGIAIRVYAPGAEGEDQPVRVIAGKRTGLRHAGVMAFDSRGDLYVTDTDVRDPGIVRVFRRGADGDVAPTRVLMGPETLLRNPIALAFGRGDTLYALNVFGYLGSHRCGPLAATNATVTVYPPRAGGDLEPVRSIVLVKNGVLPGGREGTILPRGIDVDSTGAVRLWQTGGSMTYAPGAAGMVPPVAASAVRRSERADPTGVAVSDDGAIYETSVPLSLMRIC